MNLSIIIPVYNAQNFIYYSLEKLIDYLLKLKSLEKIQLIIVNDGSKDNSLEKIQEFINYFEKNKKSNFNIYFELISYDTNKNIGFAIRKGIEKIQNEVVLIMDCDLPFKLDIIDESLELIKNYDLITVDRTKKKESYNVGTFRLILHKGLIFIIKAVFFKYIREIPDFVAGFKVIKKETLDQIKDYLSCYTSLVHFEIILYSKLITQSKICFVEPVLQTETNKNSTYNLLKIVKVIIQILIEIVLIRIRLGKIISKIKWKT